MKKVLILILSFWFVIGQSQNSNTYHRVKISLKDISIQELIDLGIGIDHGKHVTGESFTSDFSSNELEILKANQILHAVVIDDVSTFYAQQNDNFRGNPLSDHCEESIRQYPIPSHYRYGSMGGYLTYDELLVTLDSMRLLFPNLISAREPIDTFRTFENRPIEWLRISNNPDEEQVEKAEILYTALHHAREPNSLSQMIFYMWYLLENYETNDEVKYLVDNNEMYFVPCVNPDGYVYNGTIEPNGGGLWRKNRLPIGSEHGVDLNRNYSDHWDFPGGASTDPNSDVYKGEAPFSEPETQAMKYFCENHQFEVALNYHTFSNLLIHPWGFKDSITVDDKIFKDIGSLLTKYNNYLVGTGYETVKYNATGNSDDWMYGEQVTKPKILAMTPEVGPATYFFWPPKSAIIGLNQDVMFQNLAAAHILNEYISVKGDINELAIGSGHLEMKFHNFGFKEGGADISILSLSDNLSFSGNMFHLQLNPEESKGVGVPYILMDFVGKEIIEYVIKYDYDDYSILDTFSQTISNGISTFLSAGNMSSWNSISWDSTSTSYFSPSHSITDSPDGEYLNRQETDIRLNEALDLSGYEYALLSYQAKWDIEAGYDFVQIMASLDGINYQALCGNFTTVGNGDQDENQPLYDGVQVEWVLENVDLQDFIGEEKVYIKFRLVSDNFTVGDGFYFDDFEVKGILKSVDNKDISLYDEIVISPNPLQNVLDLRMESAGNYQYKIRDVLGKLVVEGVFYHNEKINTSSWQKGAYFVEILNNKGKSGTVRIVKM